MTLKFELKSKLREKDVDLLKNVLSETPRF